ncbi:MAG: TIGR00730 family Rossman fold protein [Spirochaetota bacterium]
MKRICVFCGSSPGATSMYAKAARELGMELAARKIDLVYGGGRVGLMGEIAKAVKVAGGEVIGVIPKYLVEREVGYTELNDLRIVGSMHERKALMVDLSDGFIALPGGFGTVDEFFEVLTWTQLGIHEKPCGLLNILGYFDNLLAFIDHMDKERFIERENRAMVLVDKKSERLLDQLEQYIPIRVDKAERALKKMKGYC